MTEPTAPTRPLIVDDARALPAFEAGRIVVIGNFDGVHRGHRAVLAMADALARPTGARDDRPLEVAVLTFEPHPAAVLGGVAPPKLTRLSRKVELLGRAGVDRVVAQRFTKDFAALSPEAFAREILVESLGARRVVVGHDFRFGARRAGDLEALAGFGARLGFEVKVQPVVSDEGGPLSSTRVRSALERGDLDGVAAVLGRPHSLMGEVVTGDRRGRTIGFPTANLGGVEEALPANGVYAVVVDAVAAPSLVDCASAAPASALAHGVANVGVRPTIAGGDPQRSVEVHLFDLPASMADLYGQTLRVHLVGRIREERRFSGLDALKAQIADDAEAARAICAGWPIPSSGAFA
jgi:riboflavin kinase/FMN adenylyltransferase